MKKLAIVAAVIAMFSVAATGTVMAKSKESAQDYCTKQAKKHHVTAEKMESYMKTCVEKHEKKHKKAAAKPAAPAETAPATAK
jgi:TctA family transporter